MTPAAVVLCAWLLFGGSHLLFGSPPCRSVLVRRLGERTFVFVYTAIALITLLLLAAAVARFGNQGAAGSGLSSIAAARWALAAVAFAGAALAVAGLANYLRSPIAVLRRRLGRADKPIVLSPPGGVERITRHPFFVGTALLMGAHALLAGTLAGAVYFAGFVVLAIAGIPLQDRKLRAQHGDVYAGYMTATSAMPFAAAKRLPSTGASTPSATPLWRHLLTPVIGALLLAALHPLWRVGSGAPFAVITAVFGLYAVLRQLRLAGAVRATDTRREA